MISVQQAWQQIEEHATALSPRRVKLGDAAGLVLAGDVTSDINSPPHDKAMMDGFAIASRDRSRQRRVIGTVAAGDVPHQAITPGTAMRIMTGAPLPEGADAVVPFELVEAGSEEEITLPEHAIAPGTNVLSLGTSMRAGQVVVGGGTPLRAIEIGIIAEAGHGVVPVVPQPTVAILPTGNELVPVGQPAPPGHIRNSNGPLLTAAVAEAGCLAEDLGIGPDDQQRLRRLVETGLKRDVLLISGGVSAGDFDLVPQVLADLSVRQVFHKVTVRPGKPLWFGVHQDDSRGTLVFGLPGNPVSSFVCFELFVRPALAALAGRGFRHPGRATARLAHDQPAVGQRAAYLPARVSDAPDPEVSLVDWRGSADLAGVGAANALAAFPPGDQPFSARDSVAIYRF